MSTKQIRHFPVNDNTNGWSRILAPRSPQPALSGNHRVNWVVIGAGYVGLAAARRLAENRPQDSILLLESGEVGENASGRNSGFAIDLPHVTGSNQDELEGSHRYMALARARPLLITKPRLSALLLTATGHSPANTRPRARKKGCRSSWNHSCENSMH